MSHNRTILKLLPLVLVATLAALAEPIGSGFTIDFQSCEFIPTSAQFAATFYNAKHIIGYGTICLIALFTLGGRNIWLPIVGVFIFSIAIEYLQSFFATGHCRAWDLLPNMIGIGLAVVIFLVIRNLVPKK